MNTQPLQLPWNRPDWLDEITAWIGEQLAAHGRSKSGPLEMVHQRPWAAFARMDTNKGLVYFKAPGSTSRYEAGLTAALARWRPDCTVPLLAVNLEQGWMLSADAGVTLRSLDRSPAQAEHWLTVLPLCAEMQIELAGRVPELLALGVPDRRLAGFQGLYTALLDDTDNLLLGQESGLTDEEYRRLQELSGRVAEMAQELAGYGLPETLAHEEVHENNVILGGGRYTFTDWSDCSVGHPFFTVFMTLRTLVYWAKLEEDGPALRRLRDLYLEPWTAFAGRRQVTAAFDVACRLAMINRARSYYDTFRDLSQEDSQDYADGVPGWLQEFLAAETAAGR
jgi:hypothetical protein